MAIVNMLPGDSGIDIPDRAFPALMLFQTLRSSEVHIQFGYNSSSSVYGYIKRTGNASYIQDNYGIYFIPIRDFSGWYNIGRGNVTVNFKKGSTYNIKTYYESSDSKYHYIIKEDNTEIVNVSYSSDKFGYLLRGIT